MWARAAAYLLVSGSGQTILLRRCARLDWSTVSRSAALRASRRAAVLGD